MSKKKTEQEYDQELKQQAEEQKHLELQKLYDEYVERMRIRLEKDEKVDIKPYEKWIRKAKKTIDGIEQEIEVSGDTGETKNEKFRRLAVKRMEKALTALDTIMNLSSNQYESTEQEQAKIVNALRLKVLDIENSFKVKQTEIEKFNF